MPRKVYVAGKMDKSTRITWIGVIPSSDQDRGYDFEIVHNNCKSPQSCKIQNIQWYRGDRDDLAAMIKRQIKDKDKQELALQKLTMQVDRWFEMRQKHMQKLEPCSHIQYLISKTLRSLESKPFVPEKLKPRLSSVKK